MNTPQETLEEVIKKLGLEDKDLAFEERDGQTYLLGYWESTFDSPADKL